jgi:co-chaperonin GroES (HSP10)
MTLRPLHDHVVVRPITAEPIPRPSGLVVPIEDGNVKRGEVVSIGPISVLPGHLSADFAVGASVLYHSAAERYTDPVTGSTVIPFSAVIAVVQDGRPRPAPLADQAFFSLPPWDEFRGVDHERWREYSNATLFNFKVNFLEPFTDVADLAQLMYEYTVDELRSSAGISLDHLEFHSGSKDDEGKRVYSITSGHDKWDGAISMFTGRPVLQFTKRGATLQNLHETVPTWMRAYFRLLRSEPFQRLAGFEFSRVKNVVLKIEQKIRLRGRGARLEPVLNSDLMEQFLLLSSTDGRGPATLEALGIPEGAIRRVDMKVGFERQIAGHPYIIFLDVAAPANDEYSHIDLEWEVQDHHPGDLATREYGPIFAAFFRDVIFRSFYTRWFQENADIVCITELGR